ncbi:MAG: hypothetical protein HDR46_04655 [Bacteroides sp.]|nr:hypothetical protein [Bacteroides sp.]
MNGGITSTELDSIESRFRYPYKGEDFPIEHLGNFIKLLMNVGTTQGIQHFAIAFSKERPDYPNIIHSGDITCLRLY